MLTNVPCPRTTTVTDPNGYTQTYQFNSDTSIYSVTDALSNVEYFTYDTAFNRKIVQDFRGNSWNYTFDSAGNTLTAEDPLGTGHTTTWTYNSHNKVLTVSKPLGENVLNTYDANDNLTQMDQKDSGGVIKATTKWTVSSATYGLPSDMTDPDTHKTTYGYNTNGDLNSVTTPLTHATSWVKDALGNATSRTDALTHVTTYTLDAWDRVTGISYTGRTGDNKSFTYDGNNNVVSFSDITGTTSRTYDNANRLTNESKGGSTVVAHSYDATGKLGQLSTTTDAQGRVITYAYTHRGALYTVSESGTGAVSGTTTYVYDANGNETGITNPNTTTVTKGYDVANRPSSVTNKNSSGTVLSSYTITPNADSQVTGIAESGGSAVTYGYDALGHLTSDVRTGTNAYSKSYTVDGEGNRTGMTVGGTSSTFNYNNDDWLTSTTGRLSHFLRLRQRRRADQPHRRRYGIHPGLRLRGSACFDHP